MVDHMSVNLKRSKLWLVENDGRLLSRSYVSPFHGSIASASDLHDIFHSLSLGRILEMGILEEKCLNGVTTCGA